MRRTWMLVMLAALPPNVPARAQEAPRLRPPAPTLPPEPPRPAAVEVPPPPPIPEERPLPSPTPTTIAPRPQPQPQKKAGPPRIVLGEKHESDHPTWQGAGVYRPAKFEVKASGADLKVLVTATADSHAFWGVPSATVAPIQLVQQFEVVPGRPDDPGVMLTFSGKLDGYIRTEKHSTAALRVAEAAIYPAGGGPSIRLGFTPVTASEGTASRCSGESTGPAQFVPVGRYVLVMNLGLDVAAGGVFRGHAVAVFAPGFNPGYWRIEADEIDDLDDEDFGFAVEVRAANAPAGPL